MKTQTSLLALTIGDYVRIEGKQGRLVDEFKISDIYLCSMKDICIDREICIGYTYCGNHNDQVRCGYFNRTYYKITEDTQINKITEIL